jgi:tryptophan-rich sensory protein
MEKTLVLNALIIIVWAVVLFTLLLGMNRYVAYRKKAFSVMNKMKMIIYLIPLILSVLFAAVCMKTADYYPTSWVYVVFIGAVAVIILFDLFESRKAKQSDAEQKRDHSISEE